MVEREIVNSVIKSRGALTMPHGRLIGGEVITLNGIKVGQTGSSAAVLTMLTTGVDFRLDRQIAEREATMATLEETFARISTVLKPFRSDSHALEKAMASEERGNAVRALIKKANEIRAAIEQIRVEIGELKAQAREIPRPTIDIINQIFPETLLRIGHERLRVHDGFLGPARVRLVSGQMELRAMTE